MLSATEITGRSFQLYKQNWKSMLLLGIILVAATGLTSAILIPFGEEMVPLLSHVISLLISPFVLFGYSHFLTQIWQNESATIKEVLRFCRTASLYGKCLWFSFCYMLCTFLLLMAVMLVFSFLLIPMAFLGSEALLILIIPFMVIIMWPFMRIWLAEYLFLFRAEDGAIDIIADSFGMMKGYVWKLVLVGLQMLLVSIPLLIPALLMEFAEFSVEVNTILIILTTIGEALLSPMLYLMLAGFACEVLKEHGVIAAEGTELVEEESEASVFTGKDVEESVIAEEKADIYYD